MTNENKILIWKHTASSEKYLQKGKATFFILIIYI